MRVCDGIEQFQPPSGGVVLTIGNFDGVHLGHRRLVESACAKGREVAAPVVAMTFEPHPLAVLVPWRAPQCLTTLSEKLALLEMLGVDAVVVLHSDRKLLGRSAEQFLTGLVAPCRPRDIVEGPTFNFGRGREGSVRTLREFSNRLGFALTVVDELRSREVPDHPAINSSTIRNLLQEGRLSDANTLLGRAYRITGVVGGGEQRGLTLGFPTANLGDIRHLLPQEAVYVAVAQLADNTLHLSAVNIGPQPTFGQAPARVEAHLLDYSGELAGQRLGLHLLARIRGQVRFPGVAELGAQLQRDVEYTRTFEAQLTRLRSEPVVPL